MENKLNRIKSVYAPIGIAVIGAMALFISGNNGIKKIDRERNGTFEIIANEYFGSDSDKERASRFRAYLTECMHEEDKYGNNNGRLDRDEKLSLWNKFRRNGVFKEPLPGKEFPDPSYEQIGWTLRGYLNKENRKDE